MATPTSFKTRTWRWISIGRTSCVGYGTKLSGRSGRNPVTVRLQPGQQAAISTLRIRVTDDVTVESVPQDTDLLIVDRNAFTFRNVVYVLKCTQSVRIGGSEVSLSSAPIAIAFSRPALDSQSTGKVSDSGRVSAEQPREQPSQPPQVTPAEEGIQLRVLRSGRPVADNVVIRGSEGYTGLSLPSISETPSHKGVISLDKLEKGQTHWLLVRPSTVLRLDLAPVADAYYERELPKRANLVGKNLDVDVYVQKTESDEVLLVSVLNRTKEEIAFSEADFHLMTSIKGHGADTRVYSPVWKNIAEGKQPLKMTIRPGERHAFRLDWQDWVKNGFWFSRADETIAEPAFPPMEPGKTWVRLMTLGSAKPVAVTHPGVIIGSGQGGDAEEASSPKFETQEVALAYTSRKALLDLDTGKIEMVRFHFRKKKSVSIN